ncbi:MAG TPA: competence/damage-inducible protein A [Thermoanaerobaculia bacterium]|jgi:nicotinamide-nucleotide amidase|nr:competence/damage-inducible protein A [Thermoanaerobaculia bacterium]
MRAAILAVGSELLGTRRLDTNSLRLTAVLNRYGFELRAKSVAGDSIEEIAAEVRSHLKRADLVLVTGGLGPTADDVTREAVALAVGRGLQLVPEVLEGIEARFRSYGRVMPAVNRKQAELIDGGAIIPNPRGSAPGMAIEHEGKTLLLFPGVPYEMEGMIDSFLDGWLAARSGGIGRETAVLKVACLPESLVEERIAPAYAEFGRESITILASPGEIRLEATAEGASEARRARLGEMSGRLKELAGDAVFSDREDADLPTVVGELLRAAGATLTVAESCTGGLLAERITAISGSSDYFLGGAVTYSNRLKTQLLGVGEELFAAHGAVSEAVARAMAEGARERFAADYALSITGVAGPGGGSEEKPVGTVHLGLAGPAGTEHRRARFPGNRNFVRIQASQLALEMLRRRLLDLPPPKAFGSDEVAR